LSRDPNKRYVVTAPYVTLRTMTVEGNRMLGFQAGATVPDDVPEDSFDHHLSHGLIAPAGEEAQVTVGQSAEARARQARNDVASARRDLAGAQARYDDALAIKADADAELAAERAARQPQPEPETPQPPADNTGAGAGSEPGPDGNGSADGGNTGAPVGNGDPGDDNGTKADDKTGSAAKTGTASRSRAKAQ